MLLFLVPKRYSKTTSWIFDAARKVKIPHNIAFLEEIEIKVNNGIKLSFMGQDISSAEYIFPRIDAKRKNEGYKILSSYKLLNTRMPYPPEVLNIVHDKFLTSLYLTKQKLPVPRTYYIKSPKNIDPSKFSYPLIIKLLSGSGGKGVMIVDSEESLKDIVMTLESEGKMEFLLQEYIKMEHPSDIRILIAGGQIIGAMRRIAKEGEARANVKVGGKVEAYSPSEEEKEIAIKALESLKIDIGAVDLMTTKNQETYIIELNLNPGIRGLTQATNKDIALEIMKYIKETLKK